MPCNRILVSHSLQQHIQSHQLCGLHHTKHLTFKHQNWHCLKKKTGTQRSRAIRKSLTGKSLGYKSLSVFMWCISNPAIFNHSLTTNNDHTKALWVSHNTQTTCDLTLSISNHAVTLHTYRWQAVHFSECVLCG